MIMPAIRKRIPANTICATGLSSGMCNSALLIFNMGNALPHNNEQKIAILITAHFF